MTSRHGNNVLAMPKVQLGYAQARTILRDLDNHDADQIDAAFDVLIYSPYNNDLELCEGAADYMWERKNLPQPGRAVILVIMAGMAVSAVALAAIFAQVVL